MLDKNIDEFKNIGSFAIYGAGVMGKALYKILGEAPYFKKADCFIVKSKENNPDYIDGIQVISLDEVGEYKNKPILVALHEKYICDAMADLKTVGCKHLIPITFDSDLWCDIREKWMDENQLMPYGVSHLTAGHSLGNQKLHIYVAHSEYDKELDQDVKNSKYEIPIQVGADMASKITQTVCDNVGENISAKNKQYCELTGLYWAWKNDVADYVGLSHYRRRFVLQDAEIAEICSGKIDMVVTVPIVNFDTVKGQYIKDHSEKDWGIMMDAIAELYPNYLSAVKIVEEGEFYFAYNMFIAKREVLDDYGNWLFSILKYCEDKIGQKEDVYQNRYAGFLGERLLTVYIVNHPELNVVVAQRHFIETKQY